MHFDIPTEPDQTTDDFVANQVRQYNSRFLQEDFEPLSVYCHKDEATIVGGLTGKTYWNYLDIGYLWVDENYRGGGIASQLILLAEDKARERGCSYSMLDTYQFQALGFYLKHGYETFGTLEGYGDKHERYYLRKTLFCERRSDPV